MNTNNTADLFARFLEGSAVTYPDIDTDFNSDSSREGTATFNKFLIARYDENASVEEQLEGFANHNVIVKLVNGRAISGYLTKGADGYSIKLGVLNIALEPEKVSKVKLA